MDELMENARAELRKLRPQPSEDQIDYNKQEESKNILEHSVSFADNVLKHLVAHTVGEELNTLFDECVDTSGSILITDKNCKKKYTLCLGLVDKDYMLDLKQFKDNAGVKERMVFLLNTVKVLYCPIKDHMKKWASENNTTFNYVLQIGLNTTLFLDQDSKKRIGIILTLVNN
jgi:hypothetical protein